MDRHGTLLILLFVASIVLCALCSLAILLMRDPYQRLNFTAPVTGIAAPLIMVAVWLETNDPQARIKSVLVVFALWMGGSILSHAVARAHRIRETGHFELNPDELGQEFELVE